MFRGREASHPERGQGPAETGSSPTSPELATIEQEPEQEGRNMHMLLAPTPGAAKQPEAEAS